MIFSVVCLMFCVLSGSCAFLHTDHNLSDHEDRESEIDSRNAPLPEERAEQSYDVCDGSRSMLEGMSGIVNRFVSRCDSYYLTSMDNIPQQECQLLLTYMKSLYGRQQPALHEPLYVMRENLRKSLDQHMQDLFVQIDQHMHLKECAKVKIGSVEDALYIQDRNAKEQLVIYKVRNYYDMMRQGELQRIISVLQKGHGAFQRALLMVLFAKYGERKFDRKIANIDTISSLHSLRSIRQAFSDVSVGQRDDSVG